ncbi:MAG: hypothetical protein ACI31G_02410 [Bacilli bacterium]
MLLNVLDGGQSVIVFLIILASVAVIGVIAFLIYKFIRFRLKENEKPTEEEILKEEMDRILTPIEDDELNKKIQEYKDEEDK